MAFVYKNDQRDQFIKCWQKDGVEYQEDYKTEQYPIRESEREYISRRLDVEKNGPLCRVALWTSINPELIAINYHVLVSKLPTEGMSPFNDQKQKQNVKEILVQDEDNSNPFLPDVRSQEFPYNSNNVGTSSSGREASKTIKDSNNKPQQEKVIDIESGDEDDCIIEELNNSITTHDDSNISSQSTLHEKRLYCRPMSQLMESESMLSLEVARSKEQNNSHMSASISCKRSNDSVPLHRPNLLPKSPRIEKSGVGIDSSEVDTAKTQNFNNTTVNLIDIDSDDESSFIKSDHVRCAAMTNSLKTPYKEHQIASSQMTPNMGSLTMNNSLKSSNLSSQAKKPVARSTTITQSTLSSNNLSKKNFITTPKRHLIEQPLRQNQYQLAAATKVLNFESTIPATSNNLNTVIDLKPDVIEEIEEICIDGNVSKRDLLVPYIPENHSIFNENPLEKSNPYLSESSVSNQNKTNATVVENVIDVSSDEECNP